MINVNGIKIQSLSFKISELVGVLLYQEFPVMTIYNDENNLPVIKEWLDCENDIDRFLIYSVLPENLKRFLEANINQLDLIQSSRDKLGYITEERDDEIIDIKVLSVELIPKDYLPSLDSYFESDNGVHTKDIVDFFSLNQIELKTEDLGEYFGNLAKNKDSEMFNLHLHYGNSVRHGKIDTNVLGEILLSFDGLYKEISLDHFYGKNRGELKIPTKNKKEAINSVSTEVFLSKAASFAVFIKPKHINQVDLFEGKTISARITENLYYLFDISKEEKLLEENYLKFSDFVFKSYRNFLKTVLELDINLDLNWTNNTNTNSLEEDFNLFEANAIIQYIDKIQTEDTDAFKLKGKFRAINLNTGHFSFFSLNNEQFSGYFDSLVKEGIHMLNFTDLFEVSVKRRITKEAGSPDSKIKDKIVAFYEIKK